MSYNDRSSSGRRLRPSRQAQTSINEAFERLQNSISKDDQRLFNSTKLKDVYETARDVENQLGARRELRYMRRLEPFFNWLLQYSKEMEILCNGTPYLPWIWAPLRLMLHLASDFTSAIERLVQAYAQITDCLPRLDRLATAFRDSHDFQQVLAGVYSDILLFHERAYKFFRRKGWRLFFNSSWTRFHTHFQSILDSLSRHTDLVDKEAVAIHIAEAKAWRESALQSALRQEKEIITRQCQSVMSWLDSGDFLQHDELNEQIDRCHPGTCSWLTRHPKMRAWMQSDNEKYNLWLKGKPGSGKTVLCASVIRFLKMDSMATVIYYFCNNFRSKHVNSLNAIQRSFCSQLLEADRSLSSFIYDEYVSENKAASNQVLSEVLRKLLSTLDNVRIVIDGIDEWDARHAKKILIEFQSMVSSSSQGSPHRLLISSRELPHLTRAFTKFPVISLSAERDYIDSAIRIFVQSGISEVFETLQNESDCVIEHSVRNQIETSLVQKANGMFLWVRLILTTLERADSIRALNNAVSSLPRELGDVYHRILLDIRSQCTTEECARAFRVLSWITFAKRPLRSYELQHGVTLHTENTEFDFETRPLRNVYDICRPLIEQGPQQTIVFIHSSVSEYLRNEISGPALSIRAAQSSILFACTTYLKKSYELIDPANSYQFCMILVGEGFHSLQHYCHAFWHEHLLDYAALDPGLTSDALTPLIVQLTALCQVHKIYWQVVHRIVPFKPCGPASVKLEAQLKLLVGSPDLQDMVRCILMSREEAKCQYRDRDNLDVVQTLSIHHRILRKYDDIVHCILRAEHIDGLSAKSLCHFKACFGPSAFLCELPSCRYSSFGFRSVEELDRHAAIHAPRFRCEEPSCAYSVIGFPTAAAKKRHSQEIHMIEALTFIPEVFRRVPRRKLSVPDSIPQQPADLTVPQGQPKKSSRDQEQAQEPRLRAYQDRSRGSTLEIPLEARSYPNGEATDFHPWTDTQPENQLTDEFVKSGHPATPLISRNNETDTARPSLWPNLKDKSSMETISNLFGQVLERKEQIRDANSST
ncbi:hypothetical protein EV356DRAFT_535325 [Viridothelium virens]|uniref:NACHT domain-containing protein n=1 Tax=Viridothelium virens TaxID=1048519 RepID=A0A6A6H1R3_VIRVR|nr:hypothetical protein EV356DRAFT_535325 [Viridothelium virens]